MLPPFSLLKSEEVNLLESQIKDIGLDLDLLVGKNS